MSAELQALNELRASVEKNQSEVRQIAEAAHKAAQANGELTAQTKAAADQTLAELNAARQKLNDLEVRLGEAETAFAALPGHGAAAAPVSVGAMVANDDGMRQFLTAAASGRNGSHSVAVRAALTSAPDSAGKLVQPHHLGLIEKPQMRLTVRDLLAPGRTRSNSIEFVRESRFDNQADVVAENTLKPESSLQFEADSAPVVTIAHWLHATRQILDDAPMLESYINGRLLYGLRHKEEMQLLKGSGVGLNMKGLYTAAAPFANKGVKVAHATLVDVLRLAMLQIELSDQAAQGIVLNPMDWAEIELAKTADKAYLLANPFNQTVPRLWGLPVVSTRSLDKGEFLVGAFGTAAQLWDREEANIAVSTEDRDNFVKNMVTIRAEERVGLTIYCPQGFVKGKAEAARAAAGAAAASAGAAAHGEDETLDMA